MLINQICQNPLFNRPHELRKLVFTDFHILEAGPGFFLLPVLVVADRCERIAIFVVCILRPCPVRIIPPDDISGLIVGISPYSGASGSVLVYIDFL